VTIALKPHRPEGGMLDQGKGGNFTSSVCVQKQVAIFLVAWVRFLSFLDKKPDVRHFRNGSRIGRDGCGELDGLPEVDGGQQD
jgi:hypothetical protein